LKKRLTTEAQKNTEVYKVNAESKFGALFLNEISLCPCGKDLKGFNETEVR
jgi:hypothetical protein